MNLTGAGVDQKLIGLVLEAVRADPDGQQDVFEGNVRVVGGFVMDALFIAADVPTNCFLDLWLHFDFCNIESTT